MTKREELLELVKECEKSGQSLPLDKMYLFFRLLSGALSEERRWKRLSQLCRDAGCSPDGEAMPETVQDHISIDVPLLGAMMLVMEKSYGAQGLNSELLNLAFPLHDLGESLKGDKDLLLKTKADDEDEDAAFNLIISVFPVVARQYFKEVYAITGERAAAKRAGRPLSSISINGRFFWAVELAGYLTKAFFEVEKGNKIFADVFYDQLEDMFILGDEFYSFKLLVWTLIPKIAECLRNIPYVEQRKK